MTLSSSDPRPLPQTPVRAVVMLVALFSSRVVANDAEQDKYRMVVEHHRRRSTKQQK